MILGKKQMSEEDVKLQFITPAIVPKWTLDRTTMETWFYRLDMPEGYKHFSKTKPMKLEHSSLNAEIDRVLAEITERLGGAK